MNRRVEKGKMTKEEVEAAMSRITLESDMEKAAKNADFVIEAVVEKLDVKRQVFGKLDTICPSHTILATNSSYLMNSEIAPATNRPEKVVNMHFFFPVLVMKLVEVVKGEKTSEDTVQTTAELARRIGRTPVILRKEVTGFLVNRVVRAISEEAYWLLDNGVADFKDIDTAVELGLNHPMGPFRLSDFSGLDIGYNARMEVYNRTKDPKDMPSKALRERVERGDLGRKTGKGFYDYTK